MVIARILLIFVACVLRCTAPFDDRLARCPVPFRPSLAVRAIANREGSGKPNTIPTCNHNPCALRSIHYLKFPDQESGWRTCQAKFLSMSERAIMDAWMLTGKTDRGSVYVARLVHKEKRGL